MMSLLARVFRLNGSLSQCVYFHDSLLKWRSWAVSALNMKILFSETAIENLQELILFFCVVKLHQNGMMP